MKRQNINDTFTLQIPDNFEILTEDDLRKMYRNVGDPFRWGVRDAENHVIITALWKQYPALLSWTLDLKAIVKKNEQLTGQAHAAHGMKFGTRAANLHMMVLVQFRMLACLYGLIIFVTRTGRIQIANLHIIVKDDSLQINT